MLTRRVLLRKWRLKSKSGHRDLSRRPVLLWANGTTISMKQATDLLDFEWIEVYSSKLKINARRVECALQQRFQYLPLGVRMWRGPDKGPKYDQPEDKGKVHKVFIAYSPVVAQMRREGKIIVDF